MAENEQERASSRQALALKRWQFLLLTGVSALSLGLVLVTTSLSLSIGGIRQQLDERQQFINDTLVLSQLNVQLAEVVASLAVATRDDELKQVLYNNGITFTAGETGADGRNATLTPGSTAGSRPAGEAASAPGEKP